MNQRLRVIGGGPAGFFAAIRAAELNPSAEIRLLEALDAPLRKLLRTGGGRCNLTHAGLAPGDFAQRFPRGSKEMTGPFHRFSAEDTRAWFAQRGVPTVVEADGRVFPATHCAETVAEGLLREARRLGVQVRTGHRVRSLQAPSCPGEGWKISVSGVMDSADGVVVATGGERGSGEILGGLELRIVSPVPSLFGFRFRDALLEGLAGLSFSCVGLSFPAHKLRTGGPMVITHEGLGGPAVLTLSSLAARVLAEAGYEGDLVVNWTGMDPDEAWERLLTHAAEHPRKRMGGAGAFDLPSRLWVRLVAAAEVPADRPWAEFGKKAGRALFDRLTATRLFLRGRSVHSDEMVTAGGLDLRDLSFPSFECRRYPGLFVAGEALNVDAYTGGYNLQAAWTSGYLAGSALGRGRPNEWSEKENPE
ncbi:MAG: aminoacetone oxidase family FAD-binding enzyme [Kiritimatiellia bacterium]|nr:aminoacetone oxidase family FAD-binding enzyme [Kiritimatiellia bacterium]